MRGSILVISTGANRPTSNPAMPVKAVASPAQVAVKPSVICIHCGITTMPAK